MKTRGLPNSPRDERVEARKLKMLQMAKAQSRERRRNENSKGKAHEEAGEAHEEAVAADEAERNSGEPETNISNQATESFIKQERDVAYEMWVNESDPDDVDFVGDKESTRDDVEGDGGSCEGSVEEEEAAWEVVWKKRKRKRGSSVASDDEDEEEETEVVSDDVAQSESEDEEDLVERFELEVEDDVAQFVDELSIQRREIPDSDSEAEDPMVVRNKKIRRGIGDRLAVGNAFINGAEFKEAVLDYILSSGYNIMAKLFF